MRKVINIDIPKPCHEDWKKMTPDEKGRHCAVCKKTVFDFTSKTDEQIVSLFEKNQNLCGRFKSTQLKRELVFSRKEKNNYVTFLASGLFAFIGLSSQDIHSQGEPNVVQVDSSNQSDTIGKAQSSSLEKDSINGVVLDNNKIPLLGVNVVIKGTNVGTVTDYDGNFSIEVKQGDVLVFSYIGYKTKEVKTTTKIKQNIALEMEEEISGEVVVISGGAYSKSTYIYSPEELEIKRLRKFRKDNYYSFYKKQYRKYREKIKNGEIERTSVGKFLYKITNIFR